MKINAFSKIKAFLYTLIDPHYDWKIVHPEIYEIVSRIEKLEKDSHPPKDLDEFEQWEALDKRIENLEKKIGEKK